VLLHHNLDLTYLERFFLDDTLRERLLSDFPEEHITTYFREAFANMRKGEQLAHGKAVLNRAALLLDLSLLRNSLGQPENLLQYRSLMDQGKTVIINLAVEQREAATLLGCLVTVAAEQAALSRSFSQNIAQRLSHHLIIDEFASFTEKDPTMFDSILSQTRKYGLFCVLSHQTYSQSGADVMQSLQNAQLKFIFKQDRADAEISARLLGAIDPMLVKHTVVDEAAVERTHPMFYSPVEQWESQIGQIQRLRPFEALVRLPSWQVRKARFPLLPLSPVTVRERQFVEEEYLRRYFRPPPTKTIPTASLASSPLSISAENPVFETASSRSRFGKRS
jgi:hypothetical protein